MSFNRIQKLLLSEYCEFEDIILVESPFAQTDREGIGLRQVHLGLTPTKLIMAADVAEGNKRDDCRIFRDLDPDIIDFELISVFPLQYVHVSIFHRRRKCTIKVKFCTNKVWYFELGGTEMRQNIWRTWCDKIDYINRNDQNSASETSAGSSSTTSTISHANIFSNFKHKSSSNKLHLWGRTLNKTGCNVKPKTCTKWTDKYLFIGHNFQEFPLDYNPIVYFPTKCQLLCSEKRKNCDCDNTEFCMSNFECRISDEETDKRNSVSPDFAQEKTFRVNRFGKGVDEKCLPGLYLPTESFMKAKRLQRKTQEEPIKSDRGSAKNTESSIINICEIVEEAVKIWECLKSNKLATKHERKYALQPSPSISQTFGIWNMRSGKTFSIKIKRNNSEVNFLKEKSFHAIKPQLPFSFSAESLNNLKKNYRCNKMCHNQYKWFNDSHRRMCPFWIHRSHCGGESSRKNYTKVRNKSKVYQILPNGPVTNNKKIHSSQGRNLPCSNFYLNKEVTNKETIILYKCSSSDWNNSNSDESCISSRKPSVKDLTRILRMELKLTAWDFDSGMLAYQLTLIEKDLFLRISAEDVASLIFHESIEDSPNLKIFVTYSQRLACLVATEILKNRSENTRARMTARFINTANGCKKIGNFESCGSILNGLQTPAIYRLKKTWNYLRKFHRTQYQMFHDLRSIEFQQKDFLKVEKMSPRFLPYVGYFISLLLAKVPQDEHLNDDLVIPSANTNVSNSSTTIFSGNIVKKILSSIHVLKVKKSNEKSQNFDRNEVKQSINNEGNVRLHRGLKILEKYHCAAGNYRIKRNKVVRDYLLRAKYHDEFELFKTSLILES